MRPELISWARCAGVAVHGVPAQAEVEAMEVEKGISAMEPLAMRVFDRDRRLRASWRILPGLNMVRLVSLCMLSVLELNPEMSPVDGSLT